MVHRYWCHSLWRIKNFLSCVFPVAFSRLFPEEMTTLIFDEDEIELETNTEVIIWHFLGTLSFCMHKTGKAAALPIWLPYCFQMGRPCQTNIRQIWLRDCNDGSAIALAKTVVHCWKNGGRIPNVVVLQFDQMIAETACNWLKDVRAVES